MYIYVYLFICINTYITAGKQRLGFRHKDLNKVSELMRDALKEHLIDVRKQTKTKTQR